MKKIKGPLAPLSGEIRPPKVSERETILFSFNYYQCNHSACNAESRDAKYFRDLLNRFGSIGRLTVKEFTTMHAGINSGAGRIHKIYWDHPKIMQSGFKIPQRQDLDENAWQFSVSQHENGRVNGLLIGRVFHVVWLDPEHRLYPRD